MSVVEQSDAREGHVHVVLVGRVDDLLVLHAAAGLRDVLHAATGALVNVVGEREEGVAANTDTPQLT